jgi:signal transduction histidine kinase
MIHIRVVSGAHAGEEIKTHRGALIVGRGAECHLRVVDSKVSHFHGEFVGSGPRFIYRDFLSRNGSQWRRGEETVWLGPLNPEWEVRPGDKLQVGDTTVEVLAIEPEKEGLIDRPDVTYTAERAGSSGGDVAELARFRKFLQFRSYDPTDIRQSKLMLCEAFRETFPQADGVTMVDAIVPAERELRREDIGVAGMISWSRRPEVKNQPGFSFHVLAAAEKRGGAVLFSVRPDAHFPHAQSILAGQMGGCLCTPWWHGEAIAGFIHLHTPEGGVPFTRADAQLLSLLAGVATVVLQGAAVAEERVITRTLASIGQIVGALAHDAGAILNTLGINADGLEQEFPVLAQSDGWRSLRADLDFLRFFTKDTMQQIRAAKLASKAALELRSEPMRPVVADCLDRCRRYFLDAPDLARIVLINACQARQEAIFDPKALTQVLVNCIKNALDVLKAGKRPGRVIVTSTEPPAESFVRLHICDDAGGIPLHILKRFGEEMVSTKGESGAGLGIMIVLDLMRRMGGHVLIASATDASADCPAGTIVSLCLPKSGGGGGHDGHPPLKLIAKYRQYRMRIIASADSAAP